MNTTHLQNNIEDITVDVLKSAIEEAYAAGHNTFAPLGRGGDSYLLHGTSRRMEVSVRLHSGDVKLLITNFRGSFLFYGFYNTECFSVSFIAEEYYKILQQVKYLIPKPKEGGEE